MSHWIIEGVVMDTQGSWLIPFEQRGYSGIFECNFLWQWGNVYVMDNHRLSLWCWLRQLDSASMVDILHMDVRNGVIKCLTVALSPEFSGSWQIAEMVAGELLEAASVPFSLPKE